MPDALLAGTTAVLAAVEALPPAARGAFVVAHGGADDGMVLAEANRVCWASARGLEHRLRELLAEGGIARALRQHSVESLTALCGPDPGTFRWVPRMASLDPPATFAPIELLAAVGARLYAAEAAGARIAAAGDVACAAPGGSFAIGDDGELVVIAERGGDRLGIAALTGLGEWAAAALDATAGFTPAMIDRALRGSGPIATRVALAWRTARRIVHAAIVDANDELDRALASLRRGGAPVVISTRAPWTLKHGSEPVVRDAPGAVG